MKNLMQRQIFKNSSANMFASRIKTPTDTAADVSKVTTYGIMFVHQNMKLGKNQQPEMTQYQVFRRIQEKNSTKNKYTFSGAYAKDSFYRNSNSTLYKNDTRHWQLSSYLVNVLTNITMCTIA